MRNFLLGLCLILWLFLLWWNYNKPCCNKADNDQTLPASQDTLYATTSIDRGPVFFMMNSDSAITTEKWETKKMELLNQLQENQILEITGLYYNDEVNSTKFIDLGIARAEAARLKLGLDSTRVRLYSRLMETALDSIPYHEACEFNFRLNTEYITELPSKTIIRFPLGKTKNINIKEVETYLDSIANRLIASGEKIMITGHTDTIGDEKSNYSLGLRRAESLKNYLITKGVNEQQIITESKGSVESIAENNTETGRKQNRRTELQIIKPD